MNREILFRGKAVKGGEWVEGSLQKYTTVFTDGETENVYRIVVLQTGADCMSCDSDLPYNTTYLQGFEEVVDFGTIGEYIGKTDIYGKKLFEGDIVKVVLSHNKQKHIGVITYTTLNAEYMIKTTSGSKLPFAYFYNHEIIGNIYDNPELLEESE